VTQDPNDDSMATRLFMLGGSPTPEDREWLTADEARELAIANKAQEDFAKLFAAQRSKNHCGDGCTGADHPCHCAMSALSTAINSTT